MYYFPFDAKFWAKLELFSYLIYIYICCRRIYRFLLVQIPIGVRVKPGIFLILKYQRINIYIYSLYRGMNLGIRHARPTSMYRVEYGIDCFG